MRGAADEQRTIALPNALGYSTTAVPTPATAGKAPSLVHAAVLRSWNRQTGPGEGKLLVGEDTEGFKSKAKQGDNPQGRHGRSGCMDLC